MTVYEPLPKEIHVDRKGRWKERTFRRISKGIPTCLSAISAKGRSDLLWFLYHNEDLAILSIDFKPYYLKNGKEVKRLVVEVAGKN